MGAQWLSLVAMLLSGLGFVGGLCFFLCHFLPYPKYRVDIAGLCCGFVYLCLTIVVPQAERVLPIIAPAWGVGFGMVALHVVLTIRDAVHRWKEPGFGVFVPGEGIIAGPYATIEEARCHVTRKNAKVIPYNAWLDPLSKRHVFVTLGVLMMVLVLLAHLLFIWG